jgi:hypothetical protein
MDVWYIWLRDSLPEQTDQMDKVSLTKMDVSLQKKFRCLQTNHLKSLWNLWKNEWLLNNFVTKLQQLFWQ